MLPQAYLTDRQLEIWKLRLGEASKAEIGRTLGITRQAVYDAEKIINKKVESALMDAAEANMIETTYIDATQGVLLGKSPHTGQMVITTFSSHNGVQTWHYMEPNCMKCSWSNRCRRRLTMEAEERGITLTRQQLKMPPSLLAQEIFSKIIPGLTP